MFIYFMVFMKCVVYWCILKPEYFLFLNRVFMSVFVLVFSILNMIDFARFGWIHGLENPGKTKWQSVAFEVSYCEHLTTTRERIAQQIFLLLLYNIEFTLSLKSLVCILHSLISD